MFTKAPVYIVNVLLQNCHTQHTFSGSHSCFFPLKCLTPHALCLIKNILLYHHPTALRTSKNFCCKSIVHTFLEGEIKPESVTIDTLFSTN